MLIWYTDLSCVAMHAAEPHRLYLCSSAIEEDQMDLMEQLLVIREFSQHNTNIVHI